MTRTIPALFSLCLLACLGSGAAELPERVLLGQPSFTNPSLSPDGKHLAAVIDSGHDQRSLVVFELSAGALKPLLKTSVPGLLAAQRYVWVSPQIVLVWIDVGAAEGAVWAMLDTRTRVLIPMHHEYAHLVRANWGDAEHALIYDLCSSDSLCLYDWNLRLNDGRPFGKPLPIASTSGFEVRGDAQVVTLSGADGKRLQWNPQSAAWEPLGGEAPTEVSRPGAGDAGFDTARRRLEALDPETRARPQLLTTGTHTAVGVDLPARPGLLALHPDLEAPASAVAGALPGRQVHWLDIADDLGTALIGAHNPGAAEEYFLWTRGGGLLRLASSRPELEHETLSASHVLTDWFADRTPVSVTLPIPGVARGPLLIRTVTGENATALITAALYDGTVQVLARHGLTILTLPVTPDAASGRGSSWRQWVADRTAQAAARAVKLGLARSNRVCVWGEDVDAYPALAATALAPPGRYACVIAVNLPVRFDTLSRPLTTRVGDLSQHFMMPTALVERWQSFWIAGDGEDPRPASPALWGSTLPTHVFLAYRLSADNPGRALKLEAGPLESALRQAGRDFVFYAPDAHFDDAAEWDATLYDSIASWATKAAPP